MHEDLAKAVTKCRICSGSKLFKYLDLGKTPLANNLVRNEEQAEPYFPLEMLFCEDCALSTLSVVVDPQVLFSNYVYRSSISQDFSRHCDELAGNCNQKINGGDHDLVVDIASNDGCLLRSFKKFGFTVLGVDPAVNLAKIAGASGIPTLAKFWNTDVAEEIKQKHGVAKVITGTNVFAHVDDVDEFMRGVFTLLDNDGIFVIEVPYLIDLIDKTEFDTIYHEHLSYFLLKPLITLLRQHDMTIFDVEKHSIHGGTIRVFAKKDSAQKITPKNSVVDMLTKEESRGFHSKDLYRQFAQKVQSIKNQLLLTLKTLKGQGKTVAAYGASAKGNTLLNYCSIGTGILDFVIDDTPEKQNLKTPGQHIPIRDRSVLTEKKCDYLLILAWNFKEEIINKTTSFKLNGGRYIVPIPEVLVI